MNKKGGFTKLVLLLILILLAIFFFYNNSSPSGGVIFEGKYTSQREASTCTDTDVGLNLYKQGATSNSSNLLRIDLCVNSTVLIENIYTLNRVSSSYVTCPQGTICNQGECAPQNQTYICGNGICENQREINSGCFFDCQYSCRGQYCDNYSNVFCGCNTKEYKALRQVSPCSNTECQNCGNLSSLFSGLQQVQSQVFHCLSNYFNYAPNRINYLILPYNYSICDSLEGCYIEGGLSTDFGIRYFGVPGKIRYGEAFPSQFIPDKHELTHQFITRMLHSIPSWFNEALAIQTNERLFCSAQESPRGDAYLVEREGDSGGVRLADGSTLNETLYQEIKSRIKPLSVIGDINTFGTHYKQASLWLMGLKLDYNCTEECIVNIVALLKQHVEQQCNLSQNACGINRNFILYDSTPECHSGQCSLTGAAIATPDKIVSRNLNENLLNNLKNIFSTKLETTTLSIEFPGDTHWEGWRSGIVSAGTINNTLIKQSTDQIVGEDTSELFNLVGLSY